MLVHKDLHDHVFFQEVCVLSKLVLVERQLFEGFCVHKGVGVVGRIQELHGPLFEIRFFEPLSGAEGPIQYIARKVALQLRPHEGTTLAWFDMLKLDDIVRLVINHQAHATAKIGCGNHSILPSDSVRSLNRLRDGLVPLALRCEAAGGGVMFWSRNATKWSCSPRSARRYPVGPSPVICPRATPAINER